MARHIVMVALVMLSATTWGQHQHHPGGYHFSSFSGPVSGAVKEISVQNSHPPTHPPLPTHPPHHYHNHNPHHAVPQAPQAPIHHYGGTKVDYVAKPDYSFAYGVEDPHTGNNQNHKETRDGDVVKGEYSVVEPDGSIRTVTYTADSKNGFQATVHNSPPPPGYRPPQPHTTSPAPVHQYNNYNHGQDYY